MNRNNIFSGRDINDKSNISFFDNIFYWLWYWGEKRNIRAKKEGLNHEVSWPESSFGIICISQFFCIMFFISLVVHTFSRETVIWLYEIDRNYTFGPIAIVYLVLYLINMKTYNEKKYRILKVKYAGMGKEQRRESKNIFIAYMLVSILIAVLTVKLWIAYSDKVKQIVAAGM